LNGIAVGAWCRWVSCHAVVALRKKKEKKRRRKKRNEEKRKRKKKSEKKEIEKRDMGLMLTV
jgi:hypothetical protein